MTFKGTAEEATKIKCLYLVCLSLLDIKNFFIKANTTVLQ